MRTKNSRFTLEREAGFFIIDFFLGKRETNTMFNSDIDVDSLLKPGQRFIRHKDDKYLYELVDINRERTWVTLRKYIYEEAESSIKENTIDAKNFDQKVLNFNEFYDRIRDGVFIPVEIRANDFMADLKDL